MFSANIYDIEKVARYVINKRQILCFATCVFYLRRFLFVSENVTKKETQFYLIEIKSNVLIN